MNDKLRLNTNFYGFDGIIGRRDYFLNLIYLCSLNLFIILPYTFWMYTNIETLGDLFNFPNAFLQTPMFLKLWFLFGSAAICVIFVSNIIRRLNDINSIIFPIGISLLIWVVSFIIGLILIFKSGKITSKYPYDFRKEFNWGAFFATWFWGLFNKTYVTLWALLIGLTPWGIYFQVYCGLKGNEWAYRNKKWTDVEKFNRSQETQTTVFVILSLIIFPMIYILIVSGIVGLLIFSTADEIKSNPEGTKNSIEKLDNFLDSFASMYFESHVITKDENRYYILDSDWRGNSFSDKKDLLDMAASLAANERRKNYKVQNPNGYKSFSKTTELPRTKIYSKDSGKLLGEFIMDEKIIKNGSFKEVVKASLDAYHFYK